MDEQEKRELIRAINEIRKELNLEPYPLEYLEVKDLEELRKLYSSYFKMREDYRKRLEEKKPRFRFSFKIGLLIGILIIGILLTITIFSFDKIKKSLLEFKEPVRLVGEEITNETFVETPTGEPTPTFIYDFAIQSVFKGLTNNYVVIFHNNGTGEITFQKILIDRKDTSFKVLAGSYPPLKVGDAIYLELEKQCDNLTHPIKIIIENKTLEFELPAC